jgi:hypothetical protein
MVEVIEPGAGYAGTVSLLSPEKGSAILLPLKLEEVQNALRHFYAKEFARELEETSAISGRAYPKPEPGTCMLRMGRHSGAESVTIEGHREITIRQGQKNPAKILNHATTVWFAAENKKTESGLRPFGWLECTEAGPEERAQDEAFVRAREETVREERRIARERISAQMRALKESEQRQAEAEAKRKQLEEEARQYPWKPWLRGLDSVTDWGTICQKILDNPDAAQWRQEAGVAEEAKAVFERVRNKFLSKWTEERDQKCGAWLEPAGISWESAAGPKKAVPEASCSELEERIRRLKDYGQYKAQNINIDTLTLPEA